MFYDISYFVLSNHLLDTAPVPPLILRVDTTIYLNTSSIIQSEEKKSFFMPLKKAIQENTMFLDWVRVSVWKAVEY